MAVDGGRDKRPFVYEGHAYERGSSTTWRLCAAMHYPSLLISTKTANRICSGSNDQRSAISANSAF
ncbi:MAG: hypothetical protein HKL95_11705 [Phycisphaerae bacterium]|nr:hypothetical protein [Phycisphaerae bacterium]